MDKIQEYLKRQREDNPNRGCNEIITLDKFYRAIQNQMGINIKKAREDAEKILNVFGFNDRVIDNVLDPEDRQLFYMLEKEGMLYREREVSIVDNREWRTFYWGLKKINILNYRDGRDISKKDVLEKNISDNIYDTLSDDIWCRTPKTII